MKDMAAQLKEITPSRCTSLSPVRIESLCRELSQAGELDIEKLATLADQIAPTPGTVVYVHTTKLPIRLGGLQPVVFSAVDVTTHIQIAQANLAMTSAAALSFVDFIRHAFPFPITELKTRKEKPFYNPLDHRPHRSFTTLVKEQGFLHSFVNSHTTDVLYLLTSKMVFGGASIPRTITGSARQLQRDLIQFLDFHNNFRFDPWFKGKTPLQKLRMFERFQDTHSFSMWSMFDTPDHDFSGSLNSTNPQGGSSNYDHLNHIELISRSII